VAQNRAARSELAPTDGVDEIVKWMLGVKFFTPNHQSGGSGVLSFASDAAVDIQKTISSLKSYGSNEVENYVTRFVEGGGIPQPFTSTNQLTLSFEDDDDLIVDPM
jgi:hypothetical protein